MLRGDALPNTQSARNAGRRDASRRRGKGIGASRGSQDRKSSPHADPSGRSPVLGGHGGLDGATGIGPAVTELCPLHRSAEAVTVSGIGHLHTSH